MSRISSKKRGSRFLAAPASMANTTPPKKSVERLRYDACMSEVRVSMSERREGSSGRENKAGFWVLDEEDSLNRYYISLQAHQLTLS